MTGRMEVKVSTFGNVYLEIDGECKANCNKDEATARRLADSFNSCLHLGPLVLERESRMSEERRKQRRVQEANACADMPDPEVAVAGLLCLARQVEAQGNEYLKQEARAALAKAGGGMG